MFLSNLLRKGGSLVKQDTANTYFKKFVKHFMGTHIFDLVLKGMSPRNSGIYRFKLVRPNHEQKRFWIMLGDDDSHKAEIWNGHSMYFKAFLLGWDSHETVSIKVPTSEDIVLSYPLDGATFIAQLGVEKPVIVYAAEDSLEHNTIDDIEKLSRAIGVVHDKKNRFFVFNMHSLQEPDLQSAYYEPHYRGMVIGLQEDNHRNPWNFYYQICLATSPKEQVIYHGNTSKLSNKRLFALLGGKAKPIIKPTILKSGESWSRKLHAG